jgi:RNA polymerase-binding transcription factor
VTVDPVLTQVEADLAGVDRAMARLDEGTYDVCEVCGGPIGDDRLAAAPYAVRCASCAS